MAASAPYKAGGITPAQIKRIHVLKSALGLSDELYRDALSRCGVSTSKALSFSGAAELIDLFEEQAVKAGVWQKRTAPPAGPHREGFASPAQLALIESLWAQVSDAPEEGRKVALRKFVTRQAKVSDLRFLRDCDASKIVCALRAMVRQKAGR
jgi:hypothetical protein